MLDDEWLINSLSTLTYRNVDQIVDRNIIAYNTHPK